MPTVRRKDATGEFYQCDADVVGSDSLINEIELLQIIDEVFARLGIRITIKLNNRKVLAGIAEMIGAPENSQTSPWPSTRSTK